MNQKRNRLEESKFQEKVISYFQGTCNSTDSFIDKFEEGTEDEIHEILETHNIERCPMCDWWVESGELVDEDGNVLGCEQCVPRDKD